MRAWCVKHSAFARRLEHRVDRFAELPPEIVGEALQGQVVVVGYGRNGRQIVSMLQKQGVHYVVIEQNREHVEAMRKQDIRVVSGDACDTTVLVQSHAMHASMLVITPPELIKARQIAKAAQLINPHIEIVLRTHTHEESRRLEEDGV